VSGLAHRIEPASSARAKCRGCGERIAGGELRFGESLPNPFADGEMTLWFHLDCAAFKRPEPFLQTLEGRSDPLEGQERLASEALLGIAHPRLPRVDGAGRAPTGRAQCRSCRTSIDKGAWRIALVFYEEGRFEPSGFVHAGCALGPGVPRDDRRPAPRPAALARAAEGGPGRAAGGPRPPCPLKLRSAEEAERLLSEAEEDLLVAFEKHSVEAIRRALDAGVDPLSPIRGKSLVTSLVEMYTRSTPFPDCLRLLFERGGVLDDPVVAPVRLDDAEALRGALESASFAPDRGVTIYYVSNRSVDLSPATITHLRNTGNAREK